jgi:hypothetical protein
LKKRKQEDKGAPNAAFNIISPFDKTKLDELAALMIYNVDLPFNFFEHSAVQTFLYRLRPVYDPLARIRLFTTLLENSYRSVKEEVDKYLDI